MNPKISIIVPIYNVEQYIYSCIDSILNQTFTDFELILVDDGSVDNSGEICDRYATIDKRIKVIHKRNEGASKARNLGISSSIGEYIGFIDSDDTIEPNMFEEMYKIASEYSADIIMCGFSEVNLFENKTRVFKKPLGDKAILSGNEIKKEFEKFLEDKKILGYPSMWNKLYKKDYIEKIQLRVDEKLIIAEDMCFSINAILSAKTICSINESLYNYRKINSESIMNNTSDSKFYLHLQGRREILNVLEKNDIDDKIYDGYLKYENSKTISQYLDRLKNYIVSIDDIKKINKLISEEEFVKSLSNFDKNCFVYKAKILINIIKSILWIKRLHKIS